MGKRALGINEIKQL